MLGLKGYSIALLKAAALSLLAPNLTLAGGPNCPKMLLAFVATPKHPLAPGLSEPIAGLKKPNRLPDWGPRVTLSLGPNRSISTLTLGQYNVHNLVSPAAKERLLRDPGTEALSFSAGAPDGQIAKPLHDVQRIASTILRANPDILVIQEVESHALLDHLNLHHLNGKYVPAVIEGNDPFIQVGFLFKKDLPFEIEIQSFRNIAHPSLDPSLERTVFSRDLAVAIIREIGSKPSDPPRFLVAGSHFKSKRLDSAGQDTAAIRAQEALTAAQVIAHYRHQFGDQVPIFFAADFNDDVRNAAAFQPLRELAKLKDTFDLAPQTKSVPIEERITHTYFPAEEAPVFLQLDAILVSGGPNSTEWIKQAQIIPYLDTHGKPKPVPQSFRRRKTDPSDHFMVTTEFDFQALRPL
ncbi:MAG: endonuclease/exonuclease/phosphatase family protein [Oligoflexia bacterium]